MGFISKLTTSADLVQDMAMRLGVDLAGTVAATPEIEAARYRAVILRCTACGQPDTCAALLAGSDRLDSAPAYCMNKDVFGAMKHR